MIRILAALGIINAFYAWWVQHQKSQSLSYKPACDIGDTFSCTQALMRKDGYLLKVHNSIVGIFYYGILLGPIPLFAQQLLVGFASLATVYLFYTLRREHIHCLVCYIAHAINMALFVVTFL